MSLRAALLLDIDGVLVHEAESGEMPTTEVLLIHADLPHRLKRAEGAVFLVTHRSRREARKLLDCAGLHPPLINHCFSAEDIFWAALRKRRFSRLAQEGLRKSLILPELQARYGLDPRRLCFVDDKINNVDDMVGAGVGLGLLAPAGRSRAGNFITFDFDEVLATFCQWAQSGDHDGPAQCEVRELKTREQTIESWCHTGRTVRPIGKHLFNYGRGFVRSIRAGMR